MLTKPLSGQRKGYFFSQYKEEYKERELHNKYENHLKENEGKSNFF